MGGGICDKEEGQGHAPFEKMSIDGAPTARCVSRESRTAAGQTGNANKKDEGTELFARKKKKKKKKKKKRKKKQKQKKKKTKQKAKEKKN